MSGTAPTGAAMVRAAVVEALKDAGVPAFSAWERKRLGELTGPAAVVGVEELTGMDAALWDYLGFEERPDGALLERYGRRLSLKLFIEVYAPREQAAECETALETVEALLLETGAAGLRTETLRRGAVEHDRLSGYLKCRCTASAGAYVTALRASEDAALTDFELKGVVKG